MGAPFAQEAAGSLVHPQGMLLYVCTGNTCRSPMAEALTRHLRPGVRVASAGLSAQPGESASDFALQVMAERGLDLSRHRSQTLGRALVEAASEILVMTEAHLEQLTRRFPEAAERARVLDVVDPFGGSLTDYRRAADELERAITG